MGINTSLIASFSGVDGAGQVHEIVHCLHTPVPSRGETLKPLSPPTKSFRTKTGHTVTPGEPGQYRFCTPEGEVIVSSDYDPNS